MRRVCGLRPARRHEPLDEATSTLPFFLLSCKSGGPYGLRLAGIRDVTELMKRSTLDQVRHRRA
jgi:putative N-acetylmannosamine-6-phosphate epimerase